MASPRRAVICDLDGVVWLADRPIPGSAEAIARIRAAGDPVLFVTNNSFASVGAVEAKLRAQGIPATGAVVTSSQAAATLVHPGEAVLLAGGPGAAEAIEAVGAHVLATDSAPAGADVVMVGFHRSFDYAGMDRASAAVRAGARFVGTNDDSTFPTPTGEIPGAGSILAGIAYAAGASPTVAGKPNPPMAALVRQRLAVVSNLDAALELVMVGDRPDTDGRFAVVLDARFALVLSGVTASGEGCEPRPDLIAPDLAGIADQLDYQ